MIVYRYTHQAQSYKLFQNATKKSQKITMKAFCALFLCKNYSFGHVFYIFYQIANDLVKKNETMLIVYKNKLNHFEVCNCNFNFAT